MKKGYFALAAALVASGQAAAQSSVTLYGLVSAGIAWVNNEHGSPAYIALSGANQPNRLGFRISEDLGGGTRAIAQLENGFNGMNGTLGQGGRMFGRQAFVGLSDDEFGTLTAGRQYDMFWDYLLVYAGSSATGSGTIATPGDADNLMGSWRLNNSIKYASPTFGGFTASMMYAFSDAASQFSLNRAFGVGARYAAGPFQIAAGYVELDRPGLANPSGAVTDDYSGPPFLLFRTSPLDNTVGVLKQRNIGLGGRYDFGHGVRLSAVLSQARYNYLDGTSFTITSINPSVTYAPTPALFLGASYIYSRGSYGGLDANPHWNSVQLSVDYLLSKRTDLFLYNIFQTSAGSRAVTAIYLYAPSSTRNQNVLVAGIRHRF